MNQENKSRKVHFITGLPRSGSTLLASILRQNERIHADVSTPVLDTINSAITVLSSSEAGPLVEQERRRAICKGIFDGFYTNTTEDIIFDTNRLWTSSINLVHDLFPSAKLIACVRDIGWIMDSLERIFQQDPYATTRLFRPQGARSTVYSRLEPLAQSDQLVGSAWASLREAFYGKHANKILVVDYHILTSFPQKTLSAIYSFIGENDFAHDFENVSFESPVFDLAIGAKGLHTIRKRVKFDPRQTTLPPDLFERFQKMNFWQSPTGSHANILSIPSS